jgi:Hemerythrin HHE cation binding domain
MPSVFDVLASDHEQVKQLLTELEMGPTAGTGLSENHLALRKKMAGQLVIEESKHEAAEEMYFWPAVRDRVPGGDRLADKAIGQEQGAKGVLDRLDKLGAGEPEFERLLAEFITAGREHIHFEETQVWPELQTALSVQEAAELGARIERARKTAPARPHPHAPASPGVLKATSRRGARMTTAETGHITGTRDKDYNLIWFTEACLSNTLRLETYIADAERDGDTELAELFRKAQSDSHKGAELGKKMLRARLA